MNAFRSGFLMALAENGVTPSDVEAVLVKRASGMAGALRGLIPAGVLGGALGSGATLAAPSVKGLADLGIGLPILAGLGGGVALGGGAALAHELYLRLMKNNNPTEEFQKGELVKEIALQNAMMRSRLGKPTE